MLSTVILCVLFYAFKALFWEGVHNLQLQRNAWHTPTQKLGTSHLEVFINNKPLAQLWNELIYFSYIHLVGSMSSTRGDRQFRSDLVPPLLGYVVKQGDRMYTQITIPQKMQQKKSAWERYRGTGNPRKERSFLIGTVNREFTYMVAQEGYLANFIEVLSWGGPTHVSQIFFLPSSTYTF